MFNTFFTFEFSDEDTDEITTLRFTLDADISVYEAFYRNYDAFEEKSMLMESYGVHDCGSSSGDLEGFSSYEIDPDQYHVVMEEWRRWFMQQGFDVGLTYEVTYDEDGLLEVISEEEIARRAASWDQLEKIRDQVFSN